jgi:hypothetical protein
MGSAYSAIDMGEVPELRKLSLVTAADVRGRTGLGSQSRLDSCKFVGGLVGRHNSSPVDTRDQCYHIKSQIDVSKQTYDARMS